jgi:MoaA/NifB/PqqE/SkfB family radical SAM enzyme
MDELTRIWYVAPQRLCNFHCTYCVSTGEWAKDARTDWRRPEDPVNFRRTLDCIAAEQSPVGVRLATLGEPFASRPFLDGAAWLSTQPNTRFVELVTNGSLLKSRLRNFRRTADLSRISLWVTHHHTEITLDRFMDNVIAARDAGCFVVVNTLLFPDNIAEVEAVRARALEVGIRFNVDLGYHPEADTGTYSKADDVVPLVDTTDWHREAMRLGVDPDLLSANLVGLNDVTGKPCSAGHRYFFIGIDGEVYGCSRYYDLGHDRLGNVLDEGFRFPRREQPWAGCAAPYGCSNKEDFLNLKLVERRRSDDIPSLGWLAPAVAASPGR